MTDMQPVVSPGIARAPAHPSITAEQISQLVDRFYLLARADDRLGPIFETRLDGDWAAHLEKMKAFWRSVLLKTGEYKGKPVPAHAQLTEVATQDFRIWLGMFERTVSEVFAEPAQPIVLDAARRIASSLWLAMSSDPFSRPPDWSAPHDTNAT